MRTWDAVSLSHVIVYLMGFKFIFVYICCVDPEELRLHSGRCCFMPKLLNVLAKVSDLCKRRGFFIERGGSSAEGFDAASTKSGVSTFDYGPLGVEMKRSVTQEWWHELVTSRDNIHGLDLSFTHLIAQDNVTGGDKVEKNPDGSEPEHLNVYLGEICGHALHCMESYGFTLPFGLAQNVKMLTKANDDVDQFIFRSCQKEFLKLCFYCPPNELNFWMDYWMRKRLSWWKKYADMPAGFSLMESKSGKLFCQEQNSALADTMAVEFDFPWGKEAIECISSYINIKKFVKTDRTDAEDLGVVIATSSVEKGILAYLLDAFHEKEQTDSHGITTRKNTLRVHPVLAPVKVAVLSSNLQQGDLCRVAQQLAAELRQAGIASSYVECEGLEECYWKQDEVGTPYCVTIQESTLTNGVVTLRNRDTTLGEFLHISEILKTVQRHLGSF